MTDTQTSPTARREVAVSRTIDAPRELVFATWVEPDQFGYWFGATLDVVDIELDVQPGGAWNATMIAPDGSRMPFAGHYADVVPQERIVMVFEDAPGASGDERDWQTVTASFIDADGGTSLTIHHAGIMDDGNVSALEDGYNSFLARIADLLG